MDSKGSPHRLLSLDTLRGFDMFWISGGEDIFHVLAKFTGWGWALFLAHQFTHPDWDGFTAYDLIFPLFLFLAGVSTPFSLDGRLEKGVEKRTLLLKVIRRGILLVLLGILYNNGLFQTEWENMRYGSVLARIGLAGMFAQIIYLYAGRSWQWVWFFSLISGYAVFMLFFPVPGCGAGLFTMECNPASYFDRMLLPGRLYLKIHDPEGIVSTVPAICNALLGIFAGKFLKTGSLKINGTGKSVRLAAIGGLSVVAALFADAIIPINKNLWSSSFVLMTGGLSLMLLGLFYWAIDVMNWRRWTFFFVVIGVNSIVIYMIGDFINFKFTSEAIFGGILSFFPEPLKSLGGVFAFLAVQWAFMYLLYRNKLFLKV